MKRVATAITRAALRASVSSAGPVPLVAPAIVRAASGSSAALPVGPKSAGLIQTEEKFAAHNYHPLPVVVAQSRGTKMVDADGVEYFDFLSAYSAVNQGHSHPTIANALINQLLDSALTSRAFYNDKLPAFSKFVTEYFGYDKVLPMNTGAEAVETALKIARKFSYESRTLPHVKGFGSAVPGFGPIPEGKAVILSACGCFHGRTLQAISMSCDLEATKGFGPLVPGHDKVLYDDLADLERKLKQHAGRVCAFIVEPIQGERGVYVPHDGYLREAQKLCHKYGALFVADEVQTGIARTGRMLACDHEDVKPDVLILGKAVSGGQYPVSLVLSSDAVMSVITPGTHGSTFGGNPVACAVATAALKVVKDEKLVERANVLGERLRKALSKHVVGNGGSGILQQVRGKGLLNAIVMKDGAMDKNAWDLCLLMKSRGLLAKPTHGTIIRLAPPLVMTDEELAECIRILDSCLTDIKGMPRSQIPGAAPVFKPVVDAPCKRCGPNA